MAKTDKNKALKNSNTRNMAKTDKNKALKNTQVNTHVSQATINGRIMHDDQLLTYFVNVGAGGSGISPKIAF